MPEPPHGSTSSVPLGERPLSELEKAVAQAEGNPVEGDADMEGGDVEESHGQSLATQPASATATTPEAKESIDNILDLEDEDVGDESGCQYYQAVLSYPGELGKIAPIRCPTWLGLNAFSCRNTKRERRNPGSAADQSRTGIPSNATSSSSIFP